MKRWQVVDLDEIYDIVIQIFFYFEMFFLASSTSVGWVLLLQNSKNK
jgi:hypothetical protein